MFGKHIYINNITLVGHKKLTFMVTEYFTHDYNHLVKQKILEFIMRHRYYVLLIPLQNIHGVAFRKPNATCNTNPYKN